MPPWVLVTPPYVHEDGGIRRNDRAPLYDWERLGFFEDPVACRQLRDRRIADAPGDDEWAAWSLARCVTTDRAEGGQLRPDEVERP